MIQVVLLVLLLLSLLLLGVMVVILLLFSVLVALCHLLQINDQSILPLPILTSNLFDISAS